MDKQKQINLIAYLIKEFVNNSVYKDNINVVDAKTYKSTDEKECINEINIHRLIGHECEWFDEDEPNMQDVYEYQKNIEDRSRAFTTILAIDKLRQELNLDEELFNKEYFENVKITQKMFNWIFKNKYLSEQEISDLQKKSA